MNNFTDEEIIQILEHLAKQGNENGHVSDLLKLGYKFDLINSLQLAGLLTISQVASKDHYGKYKLVEKYKLTDLGNLYHDIISKKKEPDSWLFSCYVN